MILVPFCIAGVVGVGGSVDQSSGSLDLPRVLAREQLSSIYNGICAS